jgi:hypothetical protein
MVDYPTFTTSSKQGYTVQMKGKHCQSGIWKNLERHRADPPSLLQGHSNNATIVRPLAELLPKDKRL